MSTNSSPNEGASEGGTVTNVKTPINGFTITVAVIAALAGLLFGFDTGVISGALLYIRQDFNLDQSPWIQGWIVSAVVLGAIAGSAAGGKLADVFGRRNIVIVTAIIFAIGSVGTAFAPDPYTLIGGRLFIGIAIGIASVVAPLYISEMAPPQIRGALVSLNQLMITIGIVFSYFIDWSFSELAEHGHITTSEAWGWMLGFGAVPAVVLGVGMIFLPYSPRWLSSCGRWKRARATLERIRGTKEVDAEFNDIKESLASAKNKKGRFVDLAQPWLRPLLVIGIGVGILQQASGINTVIYYAPTIFEMAGFKSASTAILATTTVGLLNVAMTVVAVFLMDKVGRRPLMLIGLTGMMLSLFALGIAFYFLKHDAAGFSAMAPYVCLASLLIYVGSFAISLGPIFWLLISEIFPNSVRGVAMGTAAMIQWVTNFIVTLTFLTLIQGLGAHGTFALFGMITFLGLMFCYRNFPETKGITLEEIEDHFRNGGSLRALTLKARAKAAEASAASA